MNLSKTLNNFKNIIRSPPLLTSLLVGVRLILIDQIYIVAFTFFYVCNTLPSHLHAL